MPLEVSANILAKIFSLSHLSLVHCSALLPSAQFVMEIGSRFTPCRCGEHNNTISDVFSSSPLKIAIDLSVMGNIVRRCEENKMTAVIKHSGHLLDTRVIVT